MRGLSVGLIVSCPACFDMARAKLRQQHLYACMLTSSIQSGGRLPWAGSRLCADSFGNHLRLMFVLLHSYSAAVPCFSAQSGSNRPCARRRPLRKAVALICVRVVWRKVRETGSRFRRCSVGNDLPDDHSTVYRMATDAPEMVLDGPSIACLRVHPIGIAAT